MTVYGNLPGVEMAAMSPSGDHVALIGIVDGKRKLIIQDKDSHALSIIDVGDTKLWGLYWAGDDTVLMRVSKTAKLGFGFTAEKAELQSMVVIPIHGNKSWAVFEYVDRIQGGIHGFCGLKMRDGKWFGYFGGITMDLNGFELSLNSGRPVLYEVDLQTHKFKDIALRPDNQDDYSKWLIGADGKVSATLDYHSGDGSWSIKNGDGHKIASGTEKLGNVELVGFGAKADTIIYKDRAPDTGDDRWLEVPISGGPANEILKDVGVQASFFDSRTDQLMGYAVEGDTPSYHFFGAHPDKVLAATQKAFPGLSVHLIDWNDTFDQLIVKTEGVGDPVTWWKVDIKTGNADVIGTSYPMAEADVAPMKMIHYKAGDGTDIAAVLTLPPGRTPENLPVIVFPHGGPAARDYPGFDWWAQALASRGYAVLQPNFRGSTGYGNAFEQAGHGEWGRKAQSDISDGLAQIVKDGIADPKRVCIMVASYGGYAALAGATLQHGLYRCAVSVAGISNVQNMVFSDISESGDNRTMIRSLREEVGHGRDLKAISPINFVSGVEAPVLLIHGKDDTVVLYNQSSDMAAALRKAGKTVEFVTLQNGDHWLTQSSNRLAMLQAAVTFIEKYNPPDAAK
ncbi:MAG: S9 family peptidase [Novosphingobium sp.]